MNNDIVAKNIRKYRELKEYSQENMANEMGISQASYAKLENGTTQINIERLFNISKILETDIADILELNKQTIFNQSNNVNAFGNVDKFHQENKEVYEKLLQAKETVPVLVQHGVSTDYPISGVWLEICKYLLRKWWTKFDGDKEVGAIDYVLEGNGNKYSPKHLKY